MIKVIILLTGATALCYGRPPTEGSLHLVYSKMLSEVGTLQAEPRSGVAYVYSITASESPSGVESATLKPSDVLISQEIYVKSASKETVPAQKLLPLKNNLTSLKQIKENNTPFLSIDPLDPKANESGIS